MERLTTDECRGIGERRMAAYAGLNGGAALDRSGVHDGQPGPQEECGDEGGKPYRARTWASRVGDTVLFVRCG